MKLQIFTTQEIQKWYEILGCFHSTDIYFFPEYHRAYELNGDGVAYAFVAQDGEHLWFYPFFVRPIEQVGSKVLDETWYDIETVYGYSGPLSTTNDQAFLTKVQTAFSHWCQDNRIIAEFIRFNPLLENHQYVDQSCRIFPNRETVIVSLKGSEQDLWTNYPSVHRNMINKAIKKGLFCAESSTPESLEAFQQLYGKTMKLLGAIPYYYFCEPYFNYLWSNLAQTVKLFTVRYEGQIVSAGLFLQHGRYLHYHLAGSDVNYRSFAPNNLLLHTVAMWGQKNGFRWLHLGGGRTTDPKDDLFRFKASLSKLYLPFYIGRRIHSAAIYEKLCSIWMRQQNLIERPNYFLLYRLT
ncbi:MAG: GNAT family N-acetyltransferase [Nostoc sp.]|uniref:GNAT family N-acetyltransferase n=1 Tax=Nostoc sp. TaxID=1180 RepID=UPI002FFC4BD1